MNPLEIHNLKFRYSKEEEVLKGLNLSVPEASIYGFLGPNGAGKSTTIRTLLGLLRPQEGSILLWGEPLGKVAPKVYRRIGTLVESPSFYPQLSALDNLRVVGKYHGLNDARRMLEVLERVGLITHKDRSARKFSTGMKQRLGLAIAMLCRPELLVLDEPTNGLDPAGISEIRQLMLELQQEGTTIFLSSHLLTEIEKVASKVGILRDGKLAFEGSLQELQNLRSRQLLLKLKVSRAELVAKHFPELEVEQRGVTVNINIESSDQVPEIIRALVVKGHDVFEVSPQVIALEDLFLQVTEKQASYENR